MGECKIRLPLHLAVNWPVEWVILWTAINMHNPHSGKPQQARLICSSPLHDIFEFSVLLPPRMANIYHNQTVSKLRETDGKRRERKHAHCAGHATLLASSPYSRFKSRSMQFWSWRVMKIKQWERRSHAQLQWVGTFCPSDFSVSVHH